MRRAMFFCFLALILLIGALASLPLSKTLLIVVLAALWIGFNLGSWVMVPYAKKLIHSQPDRVIHIDSIHASSSCFYCNKTLRDAERRISTRLAHLDCWAKADALAGFSILEDPRGK